MSHTANIRKVGSKSVSIKTEPAGITLSVAKLLAIAAAAGFTGFCFGFANGMEFVLFR